MKNFFIRQGLVLLPLCFTLAIAISPLWFSDLTLVDFYKSMRGAYPEFTSFVAIFSTYGCRAVLLVYIYLAYTSIRRQNFAGRRFCFSSLICQYVVAILIVQTIKIIIGSPRPYTGEADFNPLTFSGDYHSFPSGHSAEAYGSISPLAQLTGSNLYSFLLGIFPALIAFSRIYLSKHYPIDVLAGALLSSFLTWATFYVMYQPKFWRDLPFAKFFTGSSEQEDASTKEEVAGFHFNTTWQ